MVYTTSDNNYSTARFIVGTSGQANYTTIATALAAASAGNTIFILPGTYTENLTLVAGVNLTAFDCDALTPNVTISGTCTFTAAGTVSISGIRLQTNSAPLLTVSGSAASIVNIKNCYLNATNNTGISFTSSNAAAMIQVQNCIADLGTTGIAYWSSSSIGVLTSTYSFWNNSGSSLTAASNSAGTISITNSSFGAPISTSSGGVINGTLSVFNTGGINVTAITSAGTGVLTFAECTFLSGTASVISVGTGTTVALSSTVVNSTNTNAITGAGTLNYGTIDWQNTSRLINTTTQSNINSTTFTPAVKFGGASTGITYTTQQGQYLRVGNLVFISINIVTSSKGSSTGAMSISGLPFTPSSAISGLTVPFFFYTGGTAVVGSTGFLADISTTTFNLYAENSTTSNITALADTNCAAATTVRINTFYYI